MFKRLIAILLACLLAAFALPALAETGDIAVEGGALIEDGVPAIGDGALPLPEMSLSLGAPESEAPPAASVENATQAVELSVSKSCAKEATLGLTYQIVVPGKKIKSCKSSDEKVATVTKKGLVETKKAGTAGITVTPNKGKALVLTLKVVEPEPSAKNYMISHAMGGIDGYNYSNCLEGFQENYAEGHRIFEVDLEYTSDGKIVLWHHWDRPFCSKYKKGKKPTYEQFMSSKIYDRYTPMDLEALLRLMAEYPDIRIVTDSKYTKSSTVKKQFRTIVSTAKKLGVSSVLDRLVVEIYTKDMFDVVDGVYHFKEYMMTLYKVFDKAPSTSKLKSMASFCQRKGIATIAMYADWWKSKYAGIIKSYGLDIALYTVNDAREAREYFDDGVNALFTDFLPPV